MSWLPTAEAAKKGGTLLAIVVIAALLFTGGGLLFSKILARTDPAPIVAARKDEATSVAAAQAVGVATAATNRDARVHVDITTKEIRDAFDAPAPPVPAPAAGLPAAPVDRLRDRLNESIARANRAADASGPAD